MHVPQWLALTIAGGVILFGVFRLYLAVAGPSDEERAQRRTGLYRMSRRQHGLVGVLFLLVAGALFATAFGWSPMGRKAEPAAQPGPDRTPEPGSIRMGPKLELPPAGGRTP